jgi:hypothetical protein
MLLIDFDDYDTGAACSASTRQSWAATATATATACVNSPR